MIGEMRLRSLLDTSSQTQFVYPAVDINTRTRVEAPEAYAPVAQQRPAHLRPDHTMRSILAYLSEPRVANLNEETLRDELREYATSFISQEPFVDPVIAEDGHTYSFQEIKTWWTIPRAAVHVNNAPCFLTSPMTREILSSDTLIPNIAMRQFMKELGMVVDHGPSHNYRIRAPSESGRSISINNVTLGHIGAEMQELDYMILQLARLVTQTSTFTGRIRNSVRRAQLARSVRAMTRMAYTHQGPSLSALCRRGIDAAIMVGDFNEANRLLAFGLDHDSGNKNLLCRLAYVRCVSSLDLRDRPQGLDAMCTFFEVGLEDLFEAGSAWFMENEGRRTQNWPMRYAYSTVDPSMIRHGRYYFVSYAYGYLNQAPLGY